MPTINSIIQRYIDAIDSGFGLIQSDVTWLFNVLVILNVVFAAMLWAFSDDQVIVQLARKVIYIGFFAWIVQNWHFLTTVLAKTFVQLGLRAGGGELSTDVLLNPGAIAGQAITATAPLHEYAHSLSGPVETLYNIFTLILLGAAVIVIIFSFFVIAVQAAVAILAFKLGTLLAFILIPFSLFKHSSFMAERPLGWVVSSAVRLMALTLVVGLGQTVFGELQLDPNTMSLAKALDITLGAVVLMVLSLTATRVAGELVTGSPRLGASDVALAVGGVGAAVSMGLRKAVSPVSPAGKTSNKPSNQNPAQAAAKVPGDQSSSSNIKKQD